MEHTNNLGTDSNGAFFIVDGEVAYIEGFGNTAAGQEPANGMMILGATQEDVLHLSEHHAEELFYLDGEDTIAGTALPGVNQIFLTQAEKDETYVVQIANGLSQTPTGQWTDLVVPMYIPEHMKPEVTEMGIVQFPQRVEFPAGPGMYAGDAYVVRVGLHHEHDDTFFICLPTLNKPDGYVYPWPILVKENEAGAGWNRIDAGPGYAARIVGAFPGYVKIKVSGANGNSGRYAAVWATEDPDADFDGVSVGHGDCDDANNTIYPGATEICGDGIDQDCDGSDLVCP